MPRWRKLGVSVPLSAARLFLFPNMVTYVFFIFVRLCGGVFVDERKRDKGYIARICSPGILLFSYLDTVFFHPDIVLLFRDKRIKIEQLIMQ